MDKIVHIIWLLISRFWISRLFFPPLFKLDFYAYLNKPNVEQTVFFFNFS